VNSASIVGDDASLRRILRETRTIALVGSSPRPWRDSHRVMAYLQSHGYRIIPVNPTIAGTTIRGETVYADLASLPGPVEMVDIFRNSEAAGAVIDAAIAARSVLGLRSIWLQLGVHNAAGAGRAVAAGLDVVVDRCIKIEDARLNASTL
jgi:Predicted CoA-binding protein